MLFLFLKGAAPTHSSCELAAGRVNCSLKTHFQLQHHPAHQDRYHGHPATGKDGWGQGAGGRWLPVQGLLGTHTPAAEAVAQERGVPRNAPGQPLDPRDPIWEGHIAPAGITQALNVPGSVGFTGPPLCLTTGVSSLLASMGHTKRTVLDHT